VEHEQEDEQESEHKRSMTRVTPRLCKSLIEYGWRVYITEYGLRRRWGGGEMRDSLAQGKEDE
jgi:hypothetical protein